MTVVLKIIKYELHNIFRSKWILLYTVAFLLITDSLFRFGGDASRVMVSLMNFVLIIVPLVSLIFGIIYLYNSREFIELLLSQPINRKQLFCGIFTGVSLPLILSFIVGVSLPFFLHDAFFHLPMLGILFICGILLTLIFLAAAFFLSTKFEDRIKGFGFAIMLWLFFSVIFDGFILMIIFIFSDYPVEKIVIGLSMFNPVDLARIFLLLKFDIAALMGYTGAVFNRFFGSYLGMAVSITSLMIWLIIPFLLGLKKFMKKDF